MSYLRKSTNLNSSLKPIELWRKLKTISSKFRLMRQEDAHEYTRCLFKVLRRDIIETKLPQMVFEGSRITTPLDAIFGGTTFNAVKCSECSNITSKVEPFLDLSLEISKSRTLQGALASHFGAEVLTGENMFFCSPCNKNVDATRATRIERPPLALSLHLKRFSGTLKNSKPIQICTTLEVTKFVRGAREAGISYQYCLQNMVHHEGSNAHDGHYYTIGLADDGVFYKFDERDVNPIESIRCGRSYEVTHPVCCHV